MARGHLTADALAELPLLAGLPQQLRERLAGEWTKSPQAREIGHRAALAALEEAGEHVGTWTPR